MKVILKRLVPALLAFSAATASAGESQERIEPRVLAELERMVSLFETTQSLSFKAMSISEDVSSTIQKLQYDTTLEGAISKPDKLYLKKSGAENASLWFDGQTATILDMKANKYARIPIDGGFAGLIKTLDNLGVETPFAGIFHRGLIDHVKKNVFKGDFYGESLVDGVPTNQLAMRQDAVDWQLWTVAESGAPKKIVITSKMMAAAPQHMLLIKELSANNIPPQAFEARIPAGAVEVPVQSTEAESLLNGSW